MRMPELLEVSRQWWQTGSTLRDKLLTTIGTLAILWYFAAIFFVGCSNQGEDKEHTTTGIVSAEMRQFMTVSITTISGTLATYLGLVLGLQQVRESQQQVAREQPRINEQMPAANVTRVPQISKLQVAVAWAYVLSLIVALLIWAIRSEGRVDGVIVNLGRSILGLFGGVLAVILNVDQKGTTD